MKPVALLILLSTLLSTGCSWIDEPAVLTVRELWVPEQPVEFRACLPAPEIPVAPRTGHQVAVLIVRQAYAHADCEATLAEFNAWLDDARATLLAVD